MGGMRVDELTSRAAPPEPVSLQKTVALGPQIVQLRPAPHCRTPILSYSLDIKPVEHLLNWQLDPYNNYAARVLFSQKTNEFVVDVNLIAELIAFNPFGFVLEPGVQDYPFKYSPEVFKDLEPYLSAEVAGARFQGFLAEIAKETRGTISFLVELNRRIRDRIAYIARLDTGIQSCEETLEKGKGSCRDSAWLLVQALRHLGIAARFVSGYLVQIAEEGSDEADSAAFHAWAEAFLPGAGWIGMDPTSGLFAGEGHIPLVCTPDASRAAPIEGTVEPSRVDLSYSISIRRLNEAPSPAKPFSDEEWAQVEKVANKVDADLEMENVRLTMGGEPTFVGIDEPESPQWNIDAAGAIKRSRGLALIQSLRARIRARWHASLWAGQVVSGGGVATLGTELRLAYGWSFRLGECCPHRARGLRLWFLCARCIAIHECPHPPIPGEFRKCFASVRSR